MFYAVFSAWLSVEFRCDYMVIIVRKFAQQESTLFYYYSICFLCSLKRRGRRRSFNLFTALMSSLVQYYSADMLGVATWKHMHTTGLTWVAHGSGSRKGLLSSFYGRGINLLVHVAELKQIPMLNNGRLLGVGFSGIAYPEVGCVMEKTVLLILIDFPIDPVE
ncbi:hypothetical protein D0Y65_004515 [Glycine soja]|uniref:Uncharacterized protein n=1 Tax=Glycine soja TaxID=3848 RepID=A0A445LRZ2_GLYSO|nr:hypothetical protein D0Y65_004515 [Glycine soja]